MAKTATRARILSEAQEVVTEQGASAVTMRGVAARVGVTPMALYRHFPNREALLGAIVEEAQATFLHHLQRAMAEPTAAARLFASGQQYLAFALGHPRRYAVLFLDVRPQAPGAAPGDCAWQSAATFRFLVDRIRDCAAEGVLRVDDPEEAALTVWAHVHGLVSLYLTGKLAIGEARFRALYERSILGLVRAFGWPDTAPVAGRRAAEPANLRRRRKGGLSR
ncbi:MAG: TetR/AcrR family transcriptional regulator [Deltaproteobacteria bacterium]|nr:TetR/AcrR family transcriptional regulator [Deltaproteobacteria bacterium]